jgi:hypothetical protein
MVITGWMGGIIRQNPTDEEEQGDMVHVGQPPDRRENVDQLKDDISTEEA